MEKNKIDFEFYSEKLFEYRKSKGLSQEVLAEKIGVSRQSIYAWESGKSLPDIENLYRLCEILEITANELTNFNPGQEQKVVTKKRSGKKIIFRIIIAILIIYLIIAIRQFIIISGLNKKICLIGNYNNYSYQHRRDKVVDRKISEFTLKEEYYKDGILKEVWTSFSEKELQTTVVWTDCNKKEKYIFDQNNKTVRKANYFEEDFTKTIARISKNGMITENNMINLLMAVLWPFSYRVESEGESYVLKYNINDKNINTDVEEYIYKSNGFPRAVYQYGNDGIRLCENYYDIKLNETTDENVKMPDLNEYSMIYE